MEEKLHDVRPAQIRCFIQKLKMWFNVNQAQRGKSRGPVIKGVLFQVDVPHLILSLDGLHVEFEN